MLNAGNDRHGGPAASLTGKRVAFDAVPVIDLSPLTGSDARDPAAVARLASALDEACRHVGFFYVTHHGVSSALRDAVFDLAQRFFAVPHDRKMSIHIRQSSCHRGYFPYFEENTDPKMTADLKEGFDIGRELPPDDPDVRAGKPLHGPNQWPEGLPGFRETCDAYFAAMSGLARTILRGLALALSLDEDFFEDKVDRPLAQLRLLHYPPQDGTIIERTLGCGAHTDYGCLTILAQDSVGGLQLQNAAGDWIEAPPIPGTFVINLGDQMARWTNDRYAATLHRVINRSGRERYSVPFFFDPNYDTVISCLDGCREPGQQPRYAPVTGGAYLVQRFNETFSYRGADHVTTEGSV